MFSRLFLLLIFTSLSFIVAAQNAQPYRFQYHKYAWKAFHTSAFHIYFPDGDDSLCKQLAPEVAPAIALVRSRMGTTMNGIPNIIIYPSNDQLYESNVGMADPVDRTLPTFVSKGNRILLSFTGSKVALKEQLVAALVRATWDGEFSSDIEVQLNNGVQKIPYWISEGMNAYFAESWPIDAEDAMMEFFAEKTPANWEALIVENPRLAGQAFCYYLSNAYHRQMPANLYVQLRKRKPLHRALRLITKTELAELYQQCFLFYKERLSRYKERDQYAQEHFLSLHHRSGSVVNTLVSPSKATVAYVLHSWHQRSVYLYDIGTRHHHRIATYRLPPWLNDHRADQYPLIHWNNEELMVIGPEKGAMVLQQFNRQGQQNRKTILPWIDGVSSAGNYKKEYLLAAWRKGQSDIVTFNPDREKYTPVTNDNFEDSQPSYFEEADKFSFVSRRPLTEENEDTVLLHGVFEKSNKGIAPLITFSSNNTKVFNPIALPKSPFTLLRTTAYGKNQLLLVSGFFNDPVYGRLSGPVSPLTQFNPSSKEIFTFRHQEDSLFIFRKPLTTWESRLDSSPWLNDYGAAKAERAKEDSMIKAATYSEPSFFGKAEAKAKSASRRDSIAEALRYEQKKVTPYILQLYSAYFTAKVNNDYFINRYQPFAAYQGNFRFPQLGGMAQGGFSDLFENHHFNIAFRLPAGTEGSDFFVKYRNTARRLDWRLSYYRKSEDLQPDPKRNWLDENGRPYPNTARAKTNYYELSLSYPLTYFSGLDFSLAARQDKTVFLATEKYSLEFPAFKSLWGLFTLSYQYNRLQPTLPMLHKGFIGSIAIDGFKGFTQKEEALAGIGIKTAYHLPVYKYITIVGQLQAGYSGGDNGILYNMGGIDNNITPRVDSAVHFAQAAPYAFQTLVTPLRGYFQNSVYGNRYVLLNVDVYVPIFQTLIPLETPLSFINNLQVGLFTDIAGAGGMAEFSSAAKGLQTAYGFNARTRLAGYPIRFDIGWPGSFSKAPVWYLSLKMK